MSDSVQTDSSTSSERTEAESISTEDSGFVESSVSWIKPQLQNQLPSHLRTQHMKLGSSDTCRISCCCGGPPGSTITTTDLPIKDPRTYVTEDTYSVLMTSGQNSSQPEMHNDFHPPDGVWMSHPLSNTPTIEDVPEDPEWIRRRVVAVEQQQWNNYLAKAGHLVPHHEAYIHPNLAGCHVLPNQDLCIAAPDVMHVSKQDGLPMVGDVSTPVLAPVINVSSMCSEVLLPGRTSSKITSVRERDVEIGRRITPENFEGIETSTQVSNLAVVDRTAVAASNCTVEKIVEFQPPFVKWILLPQDFASDLKPVAHLLPSVSPSTVERDIDSMGSDPNYNDDSNKQANSCPDFTLQHWHF